MGKRVAEKSKDRKLSESEFISLANAVKLHACIWDLADENHKKSDAIESAWIEVASETGLTGSN